MSKQSLINNIICKNQEIHISGELLRKTRSTFKSSEMLDNIKNISNSNLNLANDAENDAEIQSFEFMG